MPAHLPTSLVGVSRHLYEADSGMPTAAGGGPGTGRDDSATTNGDERDDAIVPGASRAELSRAGETLSEQGSAEHIL